MGSLKVTQTGELESAIFSQSQIAHNTLCVWAANVSLPGNSLKIAFDNQFERENFLSKKVAPENRSVQINLFLL